MQEYFEIMGTQIPFKDIKNYRLIQCEYIYRPLYQEISNKIIRLASRKHYEFSKMVPYAAILSDDEYTLAIKKAKASSVKDAVLKDVAIGVISKVADKLSIKELKSKKYKCINVAGRVFECFLDDVPAIITRNDGKISEVHKGDELYPLLGEPIAPAIYIIPALKIEASEKYIFYGNSIQINDTTSEYEKLKNLMTEFKDNMSEQLRIEAVNNNQKSLPNKVASLKKKLLPHKKDKND